MASTNIATGLHSKTTFKASEINIPARYAVMTSEPLVDATDSPLAAVRKKGAPHFRRLGKSISIRQIPRKKASVRHNETINQLLSALQLGGRDITIFTYVFEEDGSPTHSEQTLFFLKAGADFRWYRENPIQLEDFTYIQPDLSGRDVSKMAPTVGRPAVIIEVIDTHFPNPETFEKLMALSRAAHHVYFLVLGEFPNLHAQTLFKFTIQKGQPFLLRSAWALLNGELVRNGVPQTLTSTDPKLRSREALTILKQGSMASR